MCCRSTPIKSIRFRYSTKTAKPPNGVTARSVSRSFRRSPESRALISRWTALSHEKFCMHLFSQADAPHSSPIFGFRDYYVWSKTPDKYQEERIIFIDVEKSN